MPRALRRLAPAPPLQVPVVSDPFVIGAAADAHLVLAAPGVQPRHATLRWRHGEPMLTAGDEAALAVNGQARVLMALRDGDEIVLGEAGAIRLAWQDLLDGAFVPPGASLAEAWMASPAWGRPDRGPGRWGGGRALGTRGDGRSRRVDDEAGRPLVVKRLGPLAAPREGDAHLALLEALAGAPHPHLAVVVDGGLAPDDGGRPCPWMATAWVPGEGLASRLGREGAQEAPVARKVLADVAAALAHLHARGVVHRDVAPGNVVLGEAGRATLIDLGHARRLDDVPARSPGVVGTPGYLAPEVVLPDRGRPGAPADVHGLGALAHALLTGAPPARGDDLLDVVAAATRPPPSLADLATGLPAEVAAALDTTLAPDPRARPDAARIARLLRHEGSG